MHFMIFSEDEPLALTEALPVLEDMGVDVYTERPYEAARMQDGKAIWIQDFHLRHESGADIDVKNASKPLRRVLHACTPRTRGERWPESSRTERRTHVATDVLMLRCYAKYLQQLGMPFSQDYMEDVLVERSKLVGLMVTAV